MTPSRPTFHSGYFGEGLRTGAGPEGGSLFRSAALWTVSFSSDA